MIKRIVLIGMIAASMVGCVEKVSEVTETREFEITNIDPPKHMYVDLYDAERDKFYPREYVSKRCSRWEDVQSGSKILLSIRTIKYADGSERADINASPVCPR
jgi:hypothetical protein